jgi:uncharacterized protein
MKFERESTEGRNAFTGYGEGWVEISGRRFARSVVVDATRLAEGWAAGGLAALTEAEMKGLLDWQPEIVLLGTGAAFRFPDPAALAPLHAAGVGVEVMDTRAACRTYNVLLAEHRRVLAAVIVESPGSR